MFIIFQDYESKYGFARTENEYHDKMTKSFIQSKGEEFKKSVENIYGKES